MTKIKIKAWNPFEGATQEQINAIVFDAFNDPDPSVFTAALGHLVKHHGVVEVAEVSGLNRQNLYKIFEDKTQPKWNTVHKILQALNVKLSVTA